MGLSRYTSGMDRVRFGRALGIGARHAAKSLMSAAEAAAAPSPNKAAASTPAAARPAASAQRVSNPVVIKTQARTLGKSVWAPFARFSSVLWLEVTGTFFAIFALIAGLQAWKWRAAVRLSPATLDARRLYVYFAVFALFAYFTVSSFVRANRRQRR
jgi:hypothetical protein